MASILDFGCGSRDTEGEEISTDCIGNTSLINNGYATIDQECKTPTYFTQNRDGGVYENSLEDTVYSLSFFICIQNK